MLYFDYQNDVLVEISSDYVPNALSRRDFETMEQAEKVAADATEWADALYIATDAGPWVSPRFDVIEAPKVGAEVSKAFNGDYYPVGTIAKISDSLKRIETTTGVVFWRRKLSGSWISSGTWSMVPGHRNERNPSF